MTMTIEVCIIQIIAANVPQELHGRGPRGRGKEQNHRKLYVTRRSIINSCYKIHVREALGNRQLV